jgi:hypothetical protein
LALNANKNKDLKFEFYHSARKIKIVQYLIYIVTFRTTISLKIFQNILSLSFSYFVMFDLIIDDALFKSKFIFVIKTKLI